MLDFEEDFFDESFSRRTKLFEQSDLGKKPSSYCSGIDMYSDSS